MTTQCTDAQAASACQCHRHFYCGPLLLPSYSVSDIYKARRGVGARNDGLTCFEQ